MRAVIQRVAKASVVVAEEEVGAIARGLLVLLSVGKDDTAADIRYITHKIAGLRIFEDAAGRMNASALDVGGAVLLVSQFTLHGDVRKGKRPSFMNAMAPAQAREMVAEAGAQLRQLGLEVAEGRFGADMQVSLTNDGPVTILLDSKKVF